MHYSAKPTRINGKAKNHNSQIPPPYNAGINFLSTPNVSNSGQLQINRKYINNMGNLNEVSVFQYHRTNNMQIKSNHLEMNHYQNLRHQQHQAYVYKAPQYHNHINPNLPVNHPMQRKNFKEHTIPAGTLQQTHRNLELNSKKSKEIQNQQEANKLGSKNNNMQIKFRKLPKKATNAPEESKLLEEEADGVLDIRNKQVSEKVHVADVNMVGNKENNNTIDVHRDMEQVLNVNTEQSIVDHCEEASDKSGKVVREKTPMCLINDLARFNKITFQYRLTGENGPAHCKRFTVTLRLGDEVYTAEGLKIKQAQHIAAKEAIEKTKYKHPTPKTNRRNDDNNAVRPNITPTVKLNALAMKLGQQTCYVLDAQQTENNSSYRLMNQSFETNKDILQQQQPICTVETVINNGQQVQVINQKRQFLSKFHSRFTPFQHSQQNVSTPTAYTHFPPVSPCKITLIVGTKQFVGIGRTLQQAKHDAASNALKVLKEQMVNEPLDIQNENTEDGDNKSPISLVFEIGLKRNLSVDFKVLREEGPAHMRTFVTACIVGDIVTEGEGTGKKISKKKAAQKMLEELEKLPPLTPVASPVKRIKLKMSSKRSSGGDPKSTNLDEPKVDLAEKPWSKNKKPTAEAEAITPITKLLEWHQNNKIKEPEFKLISEFGKENSRRRQFVMEVRSNEIMARGVGNSKKMAKQDAAQNFLMAITENSVQSATVEEHNNTPNSSEINKMSHNKNLAKQGAQNFQTESKQRPAIAAENVKIKKSLSNGEVKTNVVEPICHDSEQEKNENTTTNTTSSKEKDAENTANSSTKSQNLHMKDQLMYLSKLLGFDVEFSDYPKGNHNEFLTIVMLSTTPPQICHGVGVNANESQEDAAKNALKILSEMGLNNAVKA